MLKVDGTVSQNSRLRLEYVIQGIQNEQDKLRNDKELLNFYVVFGVRSCDDSF